MDLLVWRGGPFSSDLLTLGGIILRPVLVADGSRRRTLDQGTAGQEIQQTPDPIAGPEKVAGQLLAPAGAGAERASGNSRVGKIKESDVGQVEVGQVADDIGRQLSSLEVEVVGLQVSRGRIDRLNGRGNGCVGGGCCDAEPWSAIERTHAQTRTELVCAMRLRADGAGEQNTGDCAKHVCG